MRFAAHYVFTGRGEPLKHGIVTTAGDGTIVSVEAGNGNLRETQSLQFFNGIIIPGLVNAHCHLELSHMKGTVPEGTGLPEFLTRVRTTRQFEEKEILAAAKKADAFMYDEGIVVCADICNTDHSFAIKKSSRIRYISLIEEFGIDPARAEKRMAEAEELTVAAGKAGIKYFFVPHSAYSMSMPLLHLLREAGANNEVTSIHFMESESEILFLRHKTGPLAESFMKSGLFPAVPDLPGDHLTAIKEGITPSGNLILVHNTFADRETVKEVNKRGSTYWALCPRSNRYIENSLPPVEMLRSENCKIVVGTDSLSSNHSLSILEEMKVLQEAFPSIPLSEIITWATYNGAMACGEAGLYGTIEPGKKPGLLLIEDLDLQKMKLTRESRVRRVGQRAYNQGQGYEYI
jgi:aminodeoxyfutalosine deaminase